MRRLPQVFRSILWSAVLGALVVVFALTLGALSDRETVEVSRATGVVPTLLETRRPTPSITRTAEDETFRSPLPTPTITPTPVPSSTRFPTPFPTPTASSPLSVVPGPLPPGLKVVCADAGKDDWTTVVWMASVDDLAQVQIIATLKNRVPRWRPEFHLSPDGRYMAYEMPQDPRSESVLGVITIGSSENRVLDESVGSPGVQWYIRWSRDSHRIAYVRDIWSGRDRVNREIWVVRVDGTEKRRLASGKDALLLGWSSDDSHVYYTPDQRNLWAVDAEGQTPAFEQLRSDQLAALLWLSPDAEKIAYISYASPTGPSPATLGVLTIDGREEYLLAEGIDAYSSLIPSYQLSPVWSPDSSRIAYSLPVDKTHTEVLSARWDTQQDVVTIEDLGKAYYRPLSWSPDGRLVAAWQYPSGSGSDTQVYLTLLRLDGGVQRLHSLDPEILLPEFVGWQK